MIEELRFVVDLKSIPVVLQKNGKDRKCTLKELTGDQRAIYQSNFDVKFEFEDGVPKPVAGQNFKICSSKEFLSYCLYDDETGNPLTKEELGVLPSSVLEFLHKKALKLSGLNSEALEDTKKVLEEKEDNGSE